MTLTAAHRCRPRGAAWLLLWLSLLCFPAAGAEPRHVLILYPSGRLLPANVEFDRGMHAVLAEHAELPVDLSAEFLDQPRFSGSDYERTMATYLAEKYAARPPELIIAGGEFALDFVLAHRARVFPHAPVVYAGVNTTYLPEVSPLPPDVIGTASQYDFPGTVALARRWHPQARRRCRAGAAGARRRRHRAAAQALRQRATAGRVAGRAGVPKRPAGLTAGRAKCG